MTTYEQVRQKIIAKVPSILELKFGCEIKMKDGKHVFYVLGCIDSFIAHDGSFRVKTDIKEILGRTITIADVLRAINETNKMKSNLCYFEDMCDLIRPVYEDGKLIREAYWSLEHDSLAWHAENRPEVITFLNQIL